MQRILTLLPCAEQTLSSGSLCEELLIFDSVFCWIAIHSIQTMNLLLFKVMGSSKITNKKESTVGYSFHTDSECQSSSLLISYRKILNATLVRTNTKEQQDKICLHVFS